MGFPGLSLLCFRRSKPKCSRVPKVTLFTLRQTGKLLRNQVDVCYYSRQSMDKAETKGFRLQAIGMMTTTHSCMAVMAGNPCSRRTHPLCLSTDMYRAASMLLYHLPLETAARSPLAVCWGPATPALPTLRQTSPGLAWFILRTSTSPDY